MDSAGTKVPVASGNDSQVPEELKPLHDYYEKWKKQMSGTWSKLVSEKVRETWALNPKLKISQCIVFGLGSLDKLLQNQNLLTGKQSKEAEPLAKFEFDTVSDDLVVANELRQFIVFTDLDKAYLKYHGYGVLEGDSGFDMADSTTLVFAFRCNGQFENALRPSPAVYAGIDLELTLKEWLDTWKDRPNDLSLASRVELEALKDYTNNTTANSFPMPEPQDSKSHLQSAAAMSFQLDKWAFSQFAIRVFKTLHKDHRAS